MKYHKNVIENQQVTEKRDYGNYKDISEYFDNAITEVSRIDKSQNMIYGVCAFRPVSQNMTTECTVGHYCHLCQTRRRLDSVDHFII